MTEYESSVNVVHMPFFPLQYKPLPFSVPFQLYPCPMRLPHLPRDSSFFRSVGTLHAQLI